MSIKSRLWFRFWAHPIRFSFSFRISPLSRRGVLICSICATWAGVQSFAGFVAASDRMLLLWTTQYFTRLWCTLAPWSRKQWLGHTHTHIYIYEQGPPHPRPTQPDGSPPLWQGRGGFLSSQAMVYVVFIVHIMHMYR